jgi:predicted DNA-binding protein with PD1-like motif
VIKSRKGDLLIMRFGDGEDLLQVIEKALREEGITSGVIVGGVGMIRNGALSFYKGRGEYETVPLDEETELCCLNGNVSTMGGGLVVHIHAVLAKKGGRAMAGHFSGGKVHMTAEVVVMAVSQKLTRSIDSQTGLRLLGFGE